MSDIAEVDNYQEVRSAGQIPLHRRIAENLGNRIIGGELKPGAKLPSERQIANQFQASRATVRTALQHLEQEGQITRRDRRSALVAIKRDIKPSLRIACTGSRVMSLLRNLADKQLLPPRSQLQLIDMQQSRTIDQLVTQPSSGADVIICELEYLNCQARHEESFIQLNKSVLADVSIAPTLMEALVEEGNYIAVPLGISPMVMYYDRAAFNQAQLEIPCGSWHWDQLSGICGRLVENGAYAIQLCPTFSHLSAIIAGFGGTFYRNDGKLSASDSNQFDIAIRFIYDLLHVSKVAPLLPNTDQIDLFAQRRCAIAIDGFDKYASYRQMLGDDLVVGELPGAKPQGNITSGLALRVLKGMENLQPIEDMVRSLLSVNTQQVLAGAGGALPVRNGLQRSESLESLNVSSDAAAIFSQEISQCRIANLPRSVELHNKAITLFNELWLGLDSIDNLCSRFRQLSN